MCNQIVRSEILGNNFTRVSLAFDQTQVKLFPNFTSIPLDYLLISWVTNYVSNLGFLTCLSRIVSIKNPGGGHSHTLPIRVCTAQRSRDFEAPDLERSIHFRGVF